MHRSEITFEFLLGFAAFLTAQLETFVVLPYSPFLKKQAAYEKPAPVLWRYEVLANDFEGIGVDHGFVSTQQAHSYVLLPVGSLTQLSQWPEDTFGDTVSQATVFGLQPGRQPALAAWLQAPEHPEVNRFLQPGECLVDIVCGKQYGFFNSLLIKSTEDIADKLLAFENVANAEN